VADAGAGSAPSAAAAEANMAALLEELELEEGWVDYKKMRPTLQVCWTLCTLRRSRCAVAGLKSQVANVFSTDVQVWGVMAAGRM
jgi:hypothetical protein